MEARKGQNVTRDGRKRARTMWIRSHQEKVLAALQYPNPFPRSHLSAQVNVDLCQQNCCCRSKQTHPRNKTLPLSKRIIALLPRRDCFEHHRYHLPSQDAANAILMPLHLWMTVRIGLGPETGRITSWCSHYSRWDPSTYLCSEFDSEIRFHFFSCVCHHSCHTASAFGDHLDPILL